MTPILRMLAAALFLVVGLNAVPALAESPSVRGAVHDGFARLVVDWDQPVRYSAEVAGGQLVLRFDRPAAGDFRAVLKPLSKYLKDVSVSGDRRTAIYPMTGPFQVRSYTSGTSVVVDIYNVGAAVQTPAAAAAKSPAVKPPAVAAADAPLPMLSVRGGEHTGFNRIVFDWTKAVDYKVDAQGDKAIISFNRPARIDTAALRASLPPDIALSEISASSKGVAIVLAVPSGARLRHFRSDTKVVVDVVRAVGGAPPPQPQSVKPFPLAPAPEADVKVPALAALAPQTPPQQPIEAATAAMTPPAVAPAPDIPSVATLVQPSKPVKPAPAVPGRVVSLGFTWDRPVAAAMFYRAGWIWVVFDRRQEVDVKLLRRLGGDIVKHIEQVPHKDATVLRMVAEAGYNPSPRREGLLWIVDLSQQPYQPQNAVEIVAQADRPPGAKLFLPVAEAGPVIQVPDPEIGDTMTVVPVIGLGYGVDPGKYLPEAQLLPTVQGAVVVPMSDGVEVEISKGGIAVSKPGGFQVSQEIALSSDSSGASNRTLDIAAWKRGGLENFEIDERAINAQLTLAPRDQRNLVRLDAARHYLANGFGAEALGALRVAAGQDPSVLETPGYRALRGAAMFLMHRHKEALEDLQHHTLHADEDAEFWRAAAEAEAGDPAQYILILRDAPNIIKGYPKQLKLPLGLIALRAATSTGDEPTAKKLVDMLTAPGNKNNEMDKARVAYLEGAYHEMKGENDQAIQKYREAEDGPSRPDRAWGAKARLELQLKLGSITPKQAIEGMEKLRFAWRGEEFEFPLLKRLGELYMAEGDYGTGLRMLRQLALNYADHPGSQWVKQTMNDVFERLFMGGGADALPPVTAIALFDEFKDMTPAGAKGDEMIRRLADRLAGVDLLDRAAALLRHQVTTRLQGVEKAKVATRLALLDLLDRQPALAIEALKTSETPNLPQELQDQRRQLLARAYDDAGRADEALALLANDSSMDAKLLRVEINWRGKRWAEAAAAIEALVERPKPNETLTEQTARTVLDWATALVLANDERGLAKMRRFFAPAMEQSAFAEPFTLLTSENQRDTADFSAMDTKIRQAENFQSFMTSYRKRLSADRLSAIN